MPAPSTSRSTSRSESVTTRHLPPVVIYPSSTTASRSRSPSISSAGSVPPSPRIIPQQPEVYHHGQLNLLVPPIVAPQKGSQRSFASTSAVPQIELTQWVLPNDSRPIIYQVRLALSRCMVLHSLIAINEESLCSSYRTGFSSWHIPER
jgi:hypothetical protein